MSEVIEAFPLTWPPTRPRSRSRDKAQFKCTTVKGFNDLRYEVQMLGGTELIISTNVPLRRDGMISGHRATIWDPGVAVYFTYQKRPMCFACDRWDEVGDNLRAIAKTIEALRGIARWGTGDMIQQAFTGFTALPVPESWWQVLGLKGPNVTEAEIKSAYRRLISEHHPDTGGDTDKAARINRARDQGIESI